jgi:hypothetical protein
LSFQQQAGAVENAVILFGEADLFIKDQAQIVVVGGFFFARPRQVISVFRVPFDVAPNFLRAACLMTEGLRDVAAVKAEQRAF